MGCFMSAALELRLDDLEARLSLADDQIDQLNLTIFRQQTQMD
ncbi:MAG: SlyX, partial [Pseudomonadota bacterium]